MSEFPNLLRIRSLRGESTIRYRCEPGPAVWMEGGTARIGFTRPIRGRYPEALDGIGGEKAGANACRFLGQAREWARKRMCGYSASDVKEFSASGGELGWGG